MMLLAWAATPAAAVGPYTWGTVGAGGPPYQYCGVGYHFGYNEATWPVGESRTFAKEGVFCEWPSYVGNGLVSATAAKLKWGGSSWLACGSAEEEINYSGDLDEVTSGQYVDCGHGTYRAAVWHRVIFMTSGGVPILGLQFSHFQ